MRNNTSHKCLKAANWPTCTVEFAPKFLKQTFFKMKNAEDLKKKILFYFKNRKNCQKKIKHAKKRLKRFDYNENMKKFLNLVNSI